MTTTEVWVLVQLHTGDPGPNGTNNRADIPPTRSTRATSEPDPNGEPIYSVQAHWTGATATGLTHFSLWGGENGDEHLANARLSQGPWAVKDGRLTLDSFDHPDDCDICQ